MASGGKGSLLVRIVGNAEGLIRTLGDAQGKLGQFAGTAVAAGSKATAAVGKVGGTAVGTATRTLGTLSDAIGSVSNRGSEAGLVIGTVTDAIDFLRNAAGHLKVDLEEVSRVASDELVEAFDAFGKATFGGNKQLEIFEKITESNVGTAMRLRDELKRRGEDTVELDKILNTHITRERQAREDTERASQAIKTNTDRERENAEAVKAATAALTDRVAATLASFDAELAHAEAVNSTEDALKNLTEKQQAATDAHGQNTEANEELERATIDAEQAILRQAAAAAKAKDDQAKLAGESLNAGEKAAFERQELEKVATTLDPNSPLRKKLDEYIFLLGTIPTQISTNLDINTLGAEAAAQGAADLYGGLANEAKLKGSTVINVTNNNYGVKDTGETTAQTLRDVAHLHGW